MKKCVVLVAVAVLVAFAAPAFAVTNPFMDVPMNHWAYDAIGQLAARGVLSGYPDGTYKGKQPTTRYEMASALARALAVVDMTKASKQDVEMLKKLVVEFKDELDALGVKVDQLDKRVAVLESRLGGWKISGVLRLDLGNLDRDDTNRGFGDVARARLFVERWFGEDESIHFFSRIEGSDGLYGTSSSANNMRFTRFYVDFPAWWDTKMWVGRFLWDMEADYYLDGTTSFSKFMGMGLDSWLTDRVTEGIGVQKSIGLGKVSFYVAHPEWDVFNVGQKMGLWEFFAMGQLQFTEQFAFDIGGQLFVGDDTSKVTLTPAGVGGYDRLELDNLWTIFAGLRFNFNNNIGLKGMYYYQDKSAQYRDAVTGHWYDVDTDNASAWRAVLDVKQDLLKFTSLWLEYDKLENGFIMPTGVGALFHDTDFGGDTASKVLGYRVNRDISIWRVAAQQNWNDKWSTFLLYAHYNIDDVTVRGGDANINQWGIGVAYQYNPNIGFGLSYNRFTFDDEFDLQDSGLLRFRTQVTF